MPAQNTPHSKPTPSLEERLRTDFVTLSSHQLRTPLSAVKWFTEILLTQRSGTLTKKQLGYLREIYHSNERAIALVNDLLQVSRVQERKLRLDLSDVDIVSLCEEVIDEHRSVLNSSGLSINLQLLHGPAPLLRIDKVKIRRVIQNLLDNAITYTPRGGSIQVVVKNAPREIECSIADTGIGIPADQQHCIFERFFRAANVPKIQPNGTGLGLFIAKGFVQAHHGKMRFDSTEGQGSRFYFTLPIPKT